MVKTIITPKWLKIKAKFDKESNGSREYGTNFEIKGEFQEMCDELIETFEEITEEYGFNYEIEDISLDLWKDRVWNLVERAGLLEEYVPFEIEE